MIEGRALIKHIISPKEKNIGDFSVRRCLPALEQQMVGPWIFFDHMGPVTFEAGSGVNVRPHPHINLGTVTYLFEGEIFHRDSLGSAQAIQPGDINLMIAGKGITHSERERDHVRLVKHKLNGIQLWHALPEEYEEIEPAFFHYPTNDIPKLEIDGAYVRIMMGSAYGQLSPVKTYSPTLYFEADMKSGQTLVLPSQEQLGLYIISGEISCGDSTIDRYNMVIFEDESESAIAANKDTRLVVIGGAKMSHRYIEWNFISSRKGRIEQAKQDWLNGLFPTVIDDEEEFIPLLK